MTLKNRDDIDLSELIRELWRGRFWLIAFATVFASLAIAHVYFATRIYRSDTLLAVRSDGAGGAMGMLQGQVGGLAALAGINLGGGNSRRQELVAYLKSRTLARQFVESRGLVKVLFPEKADSNDKEREPKRLRTVEDAVDYIINLRVVDENARTGLLTVSFEWSDPKLAAEWVNEYVALANAKLREEAINTAKQSISYLNQELASTSLEPVRQSLYKILEGRLNQVMLANVEPEFAFKPIDKAEPSRLDHFVRPRRAVEVVLGAFFGLVAGATFVTWRASRRT